MSNGMTYSENSSASNVPPMVHPMMMLRCFLAWQYMPTMPAVNTCTSSSTTNFPTDVGVSHSMVCSNFIPTTKYTTMATPVNSTQPGMPSRYSISENAR